MNALDRGLALTEKTVKRHRLRNNFIKFRAKAAERKRLEFIRAKCEWFEQQRRSVTKRDCWYSWLMYIRRFKLAKKFLDRA